MNEETIIKEFIKDEIKSFNDEDRLTVKDFLLYDFEIEDNFNFSGVYKIFYCDIKGKGHMFYGVDEDKYKSFKRTFLIDKMTLNKRK